MSLKKQNKVDERNFATKHYSHYSKINLIKGTSVRQICVARLAFPRFPLLSFVPMHGAHNYDNGNKR